MLIKLFIVGIVVVCALWAWTYTKRGKKWLENL